MRPAPPARTPGASSPTACRGRRARTTLRGPLPRLRCLPLADIPSGTDPYPRPVLWAIADLPWSGWNSTQNKASGKFVCRRASERVAAWAVFESMLNVEVNRSRNHSWWREFSHGTRRSGMTLGRGFESNRIGNPSFHGASQQEMLRLGLLLPLCSIAVSDAFVS